VKLVQILSKHHFRQLGQVVLPWVNQDLLEYEDPGITLQSVEGVLYLRAIMEVVEFYNAA